MVYHIGSGLITSFINIQSNPKMTPEEMFKRLSIQMGGDGESITKDQLNKYIKKGESNPANHHKVKMAALKDLQQNWDTISHKKDSITFGDISEYEALLALASADDFESSTESEISTPPQKNKGNLHTYIEEAAAANGKGVSKNDLNERLKALLSDDLSEVDNTEEIATITNLIADFDNISGGSEYITIESLSSNNGREA